MNEDFSDPGDEALESYFSAMRGRAVPDGPSETRIAETIAALSAAAERKSNIFSRMGNMKYITGIAASVLVVVGAVLVAVVMLRSPEVTCAEVVDKVRSAHNLSVVVSTTGTPNGKATRMKMLFNDQGQMSGQSDDGSWMVVDMRTGHVMNVQPTTKTVVIMDMKNLPKQSSEPADPIERFKKLEGKSAKDMGKTEIDGKTAEKFVATQDGQEYTIWADPQTHEPIRIDVTVNAMDQKMTASMTDFDFNPPVPDDAFSQEIPKGYTVQKYSFEMPDINNGEQNVVELLRGYAQRSDGKFPEKLDDMGPYMELLQKHATTMPSQGDMLLMVRYQFVRHFLGTLPKGGWKYLGQAKTMGDGNFIVFWYKTEKGYRGIWGNLTAKDLQAAPQ
jgi:outer membrane lipoprotein-sorting protein